jgi:hypothetical protein
MSVTARAFKDAARQNADIRLAVIGAITVTFSLAAFAAWSSVIARPDSRLASRRNDSLSSIE